MTDDTPDMILRLDLDAPPELALLGQMVTAIEQGQIVATCPRFAEALRLWRITAECILALEGRERR